MPLGLITGSQMASLDQAAIRGGVSGLDLMEAAGLGVTQVLEDLLSGFRDRRVVILCGKGNNGGDGFVVARYALMRHAQVQVFLAASPDEIQGDARVHFDRLPLDIVQSGVEIATVKEALSQADAAVDALLGTGIRGAARGVYAAFIEALCKATCPVVAVDVPSGLNADTGQIEGSCAAATRTVTFALPRIGHFFYPGRTHCGRLHLVDIGIPSSVVQAEKIDTFLIDNHLCASLMPHRAPDAHKGDCGRVFVLAGSVGLTGAAALCATAALKGGAGLVTLGVPESLNDILEVKVTEVMTWPLPEVKKARCLALRARGDVLRGLKTAECVAIGPGLGTHRETVELVRRLVRDLDVPAVIDADALNALSGDVEVLHACRAPVVITPHPGEFSRLTGRSVADICKAPIAAARAFATKYAVVVVLKGAPTVVALPCGDVYINPTGNPGMASGGTGDVLTGLVTALIGQGVDVGQAACLGVYLHGLAGDLASKTTGHMGLVASDVIDHLPDATHQVLSGMDRHRELYFHPNPTL